MKRRDLLVASAAYCALVPVRATGQPAKAPVRIGWLYPGTGGQLAVNLEAFNVKMKGLGYVQGRDYANEMVLSEGQLERLPGLAKGIVASKPTVIVTAGAAAVLALSASPHFS